MTEFDPIEFGAAMGLLIKEATSPLQARVAELEKMLAERPSPEEIAKQAATMIPAPKDGEPGKDADMNVLKGHLEDLVKAIHVPADGQSVTVEDVAPLIREEVAKAVAEVPPTKDGESVTAEDVRPLLAELVGEAVKALPPAEKGQDADMDALRAHLGELVKAIHLPAVPGVDEVAATFERRFSDLTLSWERQARDTFEKAADRMPKPQDGRDALPLESFDMVLGEDGRTVTVKMQAGETVIEKCVKIPALIDRGVYKAETPYETGDGVSYGGCFWIAKCDSPQGVPGSGETDWRRAVNRGRDGKDLRDNASRHDPSKGVSIK